MWGCDHRQGMDWWIDLLTTCIHHLELHFTDHWHTQTSVLSLLQSPLAASWQWLLPREILQLPVFRSSCHSHLCWTLVNWQLNQLDPRLAAISHQLPSLIFTGWLSTELCPLPTCYFTSLHWTELLTTPNWTAYSSAGFLVIQPQAGPNKKHCLQQSFCHSHGWLPSNRLDIISTRTCLPTVA
jgi:hypothetical protein